MADQAASIEDDEEIIAKIESGIGRSYFGDSRSLDASPLGERIRRSVQSTRLLWNLFPLAFVGSVALVLSLVLFILAPWPLAAFMAFLGFGLMVRECVPMLIDSPDRRNRVWNIRVWSSWFDICNSANRTDRSWVTFDDLEGRIYFPKLLAVKWVQGQGLRIDFRKLPSGDDSAPKNFQSMEETLRGALGFTQGRVVTYEEPGKREVVTFILTNYKLPVHQDATIAMFQNGEGMVPVGMSLGNIFLWWNQLATYHGLVSGESGFGKSSWIRIRIVKALWDGWDCWAFDGKMIDLGWLRALGQRVWKNNGTASLVAEFWDTILEEIQVRKEVMDKASVSADWSRWLKRLAWLDALPADEAHTWLEAHNILTPLADLPRRRILVVVDEAGSVTRGKTSLHKQMHENIAQVVEVGRALGFHFVFGVQRPDVVNLAGELGGSVRAQTNFVIGVGETEENGRKMMFGPHALDPDVGISSSAKTADGDRIFGRCAVLGAVSATGDVLCTQLPWLDEEKAMRIVMARRPETDTPTAHKWIEEAYGDLQ